MIGVNVRLKAVFELKAQFCQDGQIPSDRFEDRVDKHGPFRIAASDQIGVGRGLLFEELPEDHRPACPMQGGQASRSEEHTSEIQSLMRISYAVFCLKKKIHRS